MKDAPQTSWQALERVLTPSDCLSVSPGGDLMIDGCSAPELVARFGSPLYVTSEATFRQNLRDVRKAFEEAWPAGVKILYAIKSNTSVALRAIAHAEGAGSDCATLGELHVTFEGGADPATVTLNGSNKQTDEIDLAVARGALVVVDVAEDIERIAQAARQHGRRARVLLRLKGIDHTYLAASRSDLLSGVSSYLDEAMRKKWGVGLAEGIALTQRILRETDLNLEGFHTHLGRWSRDTEFFAANHMQFARCVCEIAKATGYRPTLIDIGGGWPRRRDPESTGEVPNPFGIDDYAREVCRGIAAVFHEAGQPLPALWLEPGRYISGNAGLLLASVGVVKKDEGRCWVNLDASNDSVRAIDLLKQANAIVAATGMQRPLDLIADIVGALCISTQFARDHRLPGVRRGDLLAFLDTGCYAEAMSSQFNSLPRPATVLVHRGEAELVRRREELADVLRTQLVPARLRATADFGTAGARQERAS